ncbi:MAG TPA: sigma-54 dependent transcriptional regulator [Cellvibrionaceae bacterium]
MQRVLIIDDNPGVGKALSLLLSLHDLDSEVVLTPQAGLQRLQQDSRIALVLQDMNFTTDTTSGEEGRQLFAAIRQLHPDLPVILLTAWTQLETAIDLVKQGAADYLAKPWDDQKLITTVKNLLELQDLQTRQLQQAQDRHSDKQRLQQTADLCGLVYQSDTMHELAKMAIKIARTDMPVLISGPNGSGKEKIAQIIQRNSAVKNGPFVCVNVGALPNELMEVELFGAEAGAYTGISKTRLGRFETAHGGTLFLDELGNLSASGQAKLLRVLQTGQFERLGSSETRHCQVRIISATNANLPDAIEKGLFREDLFYRINVFELTIPPLAERVDDILPLLHFFLGSKAEISPKALQWLQAYPWPGNVRELENACQRARILGAEEGGKPMLEFEHFGIEFEPEKNPPKIQVEPSREMIIHALRDNHGVVAQAARQLGLSRQALYRRIEQYDIRGL